MYLQLLVCIICYKLIVIIKSKKNILRVNYKYKGKKTNEND